MTAQTADERDYAGHMRAVFDAEMAGSEPLPSVAARVVAKLRMTDPGLLAGWLDSNAVNFVRDAMGTVDRSTRSHARKARPASMFADAARAAEEGDPVSLSSWLDARYVIDEDGARAVLRDMRREHLVFVADRYETDARAASFEAVFMRALVKKVGARTVGEVFSPDQIESLRKRLVA